MFPNRDHIARTPVREVALGCVEAGIRAAHPETVFAERVEVRDDVLYVDGARFDLSAYEDVYVVGGGNVAGHVAAELERLLGDRITAGVVVTDDPVDTDSIDVVEGDYPVPSERCMLGTRRVLQLAEEATADDLVLTALSGGGSPLLSAPVPDISLSDLQTVTEDLFANGVSDKHVNVVRKHLSAVKGGKLARAAAPAAIVTLLFSDVVSQKRTAVASGPTLPDESTYADALEIFDRYGISPPTRVKHHLERGRSGAIPETPTAEADAFDRASCITIADGMTALRGAQAKAESLGFESLILTTRLRGRAQESVKPLVGIGEECYFSGTPVEPPAVLLAAGQTSIPTFGSMKQGPNQEFALSGAVEFHETLGAAAALASVATDGVDGHAECSGAVVDHTSAEPMSDAWDALNTNRISQQLSRNGDRVPSVPTGTNVNDLHVLVIQDE
ncbi:DUF4147 domain-containing protein [Halorarum salinum]|uniref:DUF4147 domain-containing protein n=2 Tax=Halorarum salinum TaxID=2743089 RepID=A0A7D5QN86_9EURY|nr:DUF4147 domain-containing protein [Halobaculum salinum]